jgi:hypothetical protein
VFAYSDGANYVAGSHHANSAYPLAQENGNPRGIADASQFDITNIPSSQLQNPQLPQDVNDDQKVSAVDALIIINWMGQAANVKTESEDFTTKNESEYFTDVNGDRRVTALDALQVINFLLKSRAGQFGGEVETLPQIDSSQPSGSRVSSTDSAIADLSARATAKVTSTWLPSRDAHAQRIALSDGKGDVEDDDDVLDLLAEDLLAQQSLRSDMGYADLESDS